MKILDWLFGGNDEASGSTVDPAVIDQRIEQVVTIVDPRLKLVPGYHRRLAPSVRLAVLYCRELEAQIPPAIDMSAAAWSGSPMLRALFASAQEIPAVFSRSTEVQGLFADSPGLDEVWATLRFVRREQKGFGLAAHGEVVQRDVARTSVSFGEKKVVQPCACERDARLGLRRRAFKFLVTQALEEIASVDTRRADLREQCSMLRTRLDLLKGQRAGLEAMLESDGKASVEKIEEVERKLAENETSLAEFPRVGETLDFAMNRVQTVLEHGSDYLQVRVVKLRLDQMNILVPLGSAEPAIEIALPEVLVRRTPVLHLLDCRFPRSELIQRGRLIDEAQRLLG